MIEEAAQLIDDIGRPLTLQKVTTGNYTPGTGSSTVTTATHDVFGMMLNYSDRSIDGTLIKTGDRKCVLKAKDLEAEPTEGDVIIDGTDKFNVVNSRRVEIQGDAIIFSLQVRK